MEINLGHVFSPVISSHWLHCCALSFYLTTGVQETEELNARAKIEEAARREKETQRLAQEAEENKMTDNEESRRAEDEERKQAAQREWHTQLKEGLKEAIKSEMMPEIESSIAAVKRENVPGCSELVLKVACAAIGYVCQTS